MSNKPIHTVDLDNGLQVAFYDESKKVAADRYMVRLRFAMQIPVDDARRAALGSTVTFEQVRERIFVPADHKQTVFQTLLDTCVSHAVQYLGHPEFVERYLQKISAEQKGA